jgi:hypothetical protein
MTRLVSRLPVGGWPRSLTGLAVWRLERQIILVSTCFSASETGWNVQHYLQLVLSWLLVLPCVGNFLLSSSVNGCTWKVICCCCYLIILVLVDQISLINFKTTPPPFNKLSPPLLVVPIHDLFFHGWVINVQLFASTAKLFDQFYWAA